MNTNPALLAEILGIVQKDGNELCLPYKSTDIPCKFYHNFP